MKFPFFLFSPLFFVFGSFAKVTEPLPGQETSFHGFSMFSDSKKETKIVVPQKIAPGKPWVWRARFWGHEPQFDLAMLELGYHVVFCNVRNLFGNHEAIERGNRFYDYLVTQHEFSKKAILEGMSRGGLFIYNWAAANPGKVAAIYGDAPVLDFKSWPGGKGIGQGSASAWKTCLMAYGLTEETAQDFTGNPIDNLQALAKAGISIIHVVGAADIVVPVAENTTIAEKRYQKLGGVFEVIQKEGVGHHPHSLKDPAPIVSFILRNHK